MKKMILLFFALLLIAGGIFFYLGQEEEPTVIAEDDAWETIKEAYIYTYPLMMVDATKNEVAKSLGISDEDVTNHLIHSKDLSKVGETSDTFSNMDILYSQVFLDLAKEPIIFEKPATNRFLSIEVMDAYTNSVTLLGTGGDTQKSSTYMITGPEYDGTIPSEVTHIELPTYMGWMIIRTEVNEGEDLANAYKLQDSMEIMPESTWKMEEKPRIETFEYEKNIIPRAEDLNFSIEEYFDHANNLMMKNPPAEGDIGVLKDLQNIGVGSGLDFDLVAILGEDATNVEEKWETMKEEATVEMEEDSKGYISELGDWSFYGEPIADFGDKYKYRAYVADTMLGAGSLDLAIYTELSDLNGEKLSSENSYVIHFEKEELPPVKAYGFWSITAYGKDGYIMDNELSRYIINDESDVKYNSDGSLDILVQKSEPLDKTMKNNWLPVNDEEFTLMMRVYLPEEDILSGKWNAPQVIKGNKK